MPKNTSSAKKTRQSSSLKENQKKNEETTKMEEEKEKTTERSVRKRLNKLNIAELEKSDDEDSFDPVPKKSAQKNGESEKKVKKNNEDSRKAKGAKASTAKKATGSSKKKKKGGDSESEDEYIPGKGEANEEESEVELDSEIDDESAPGSDEMDEEVVDWDKDESKGKRGKRSGNGNQKSKGAAKGKGAANGNSSKGGGLKKGVSPFMNDKRKGELENNLAQEIDMTQQVLTEEDMKLPYWLEPENMRDAEGKKPTDKDYDPSTLLIPAAEYNKLKGTKKQYWDIKRKNFDKIVIFKTWKFYYIYGTDALIVHKLCNIRLSQARGNDLLQVFFHESRLEKTATELVTGGQKVIVVEQMDAFNEKKDAVMRREVTQVITRGTATDLELNDFEAKYTLCVFEKEEHFYGVTFFDATTHEFFMDQFKDDGNMTLLRSLVTRIRPVEVVCVVGFCTQNTLRMIKAVCNPQVSNFRLRYFPQTAWMYQEMFKVFQVKQTKSFESESSQPFSDLCEFSKDVLSKENKEHIPEYLVEVLEEQSKQAQVFQKENSKGKENKESDLEYGLMLHSLYACFIYLQGILLADTVFRFGDFSSFDTQLQAASGGSYMVLDAHTISNLDLLEPPSMTHLSKSPEFNAMRSMYPSYDLLHVLDHAVTGYGKRMLKRWLLYPSKDPKVIVDRQEAIQDLMNSPDVVKRFQERLGELQDIERSVNRIYNLANKQRLDGVYFENYQQERLKDFYNLVQKLKKVEPIISLFEENEVKINSERLKRLTTFQPDAKMPAKKIRKAQAGMFPRINETLTSFEGMIEKRGDNERLCPASGVSEPYDNVVEQMRKLSERIAKWTEEQRKKFKAADAKNINVFRGGKGYEIEIPEELLKGGNKLGSEFIITSKRKGASRFMNGFLEELTVEERRITERFREALVPFLLQVFTGFHKENSKWRQMISCLAEIDTLCSLALACDEWDIKCRPKIVPLNTSKGMSIEKQRGAFKLYGILHPCMKVFKRDYVSNDIVFNEEKSVLMVTGPNMGGKSTVLREACLALVLAQMGCWVPAQHFEFSVVDRIFTRIGASDSILEGKSTFFIEMEETLNVVKDATPSSFVIMDELGRGTSTYDGLAIAYSVLREVLESNKCLMLFATHYHSLVEDFRLFKEVDYYMMDSELDPEHEAIRFLYKFVKGHVGRSFGLQVAKLAGVPSDLIKIAEDHSTDLHRVKLAMDTYQELNASFNSIMGELMACSSF